MKRSLKETMGYTIEAMDGTEGKVKDYLFDEEQWVIRYLEADLGKFFPGKKVLIPHKSLKKPTWEREHFLVDLTKEDIEKCPPLEDDLPVSRKYEEELNRQYKIENYWTYVTIPAYIPQLVTAKSVKEEDIDTKLRSFHEVNGYHVETLDGRLGHITDFIIDDSNLQIVYLILDTSDWFPWSKKEMIPVGMMEEISYVNKRIKVNLHSDTIKHAPKYDPTSSISDRYEKKLKAHYDKIETDH